MTSVPTSPTAIDFFVSYTGKDQAWAEWIAWKLEEAGHKTVIQAWDFKSGGVFPGDMHRALKQSARVIAVLTPAYMDSGFCQPEWQAAFAMDPTGEKEILVCVRVADFKPDGILTGRTYIDLVGKDAASSAAFLLERLKPGRAKPTIAPAHPLTIEKPATTSPAFPGSPNLPKAFIPNQSSSIHHYLPRLDPFFGRTVELAEIADSLSENSGTWGIVIDGQGGLGKTSLAVRAAMDSPPERFARKIFLSAQQHKMDAHGMRRLDGFAFSGWLEMINVIARELGQPDIAKAVETERPALLCAALAGSRSLLILDNLEALTDSEQQDLLNFLEHLPLDCKVILTTRPTHGAETNRLSQVENRVLLEKLDQQSAMQSLDQIAKHNKLLAATSNEQRISLYAQTNGNPLLLRWVVGQLGSGSCMTLDDALAFLRSCPDDNNPLEFIFGDLLRSFKDDELRVLATLTYPAEPIDGQVIAEISGLSVKDTFAAAKRLTNRAVTTVDVSGRLFTLVPMVADFLQHERRELITETGNRLEKRAYALIMKNGYQNHNRFPALEAAWPSIAPALPLFLAVDNARLQTLCDALTTFFEFQGRWDEWLAFSEKAEAKAVAAAEHDHAGWRAYQAGVIHSRRQQADAVLACAERAAEHWDRAKADARARAIAIALRGSGHRLKGDCPAAIIDCREVLDLHRSLAAESQDVATALNDLAAAEHVSDDFVAAEGHYIEALRVARAVGYAEGVATYIGNLSELALARKDWLAAEILAREALPLAEAVHRQELIALDNHRLAQALVRQSKATEAHPHSQRAVDIYTRLGLPGLIHAKATLAECEAALAGK